MSGLVPLPCALSGVVWIKKKRGLSAPGPRISSGSDCDCDLGFPTPRKATGVGRSASASASASAWWISPTHRVGTAGVGVCFVRCVKSASSVGQRAAAAFKCFKWSPTESVGWDGACGPARTTGPGLSYSCLDVRIPRGSGHGEEGLMAQDGRWRCSLLTAHGSRLTAHALTHASLCWLLTAQCWRREGWSLRSSGTSSRVWGTEGDGSGWWMRNRGRRSQPGCCDRTDDFLLRIVLSVVAAGDGATRCRSTSQASPSATKGPIVAVLYRELRSRPSLSLRLPARGLHSTIPIPAWTTPKAARRGRARLQLSRIEGQWPSPVAESPWIGCGK